MQGMQIAFFGSSLVSAHWNGAAAYYRGLIRQLHERGHRVTFYEPDAFDRQKHRDMPDPPWAKVAVYPSQGEDGVRRALEAASRADLIVKAGGVGIFDELLEGAVPSLRRYGVRAVFWDVDPQATLERLRRNPADAFRRRIADYDLVLTYGGGDAVAGEYRSLGARDCVPIYNGFDPDTHHPAAPEERYRAAAGFLGNRLPDRESRVEEFFLKPAADCPDRRFILGGGGWHDKPLPSNVGYLGHVYTHEHNAFNGTPDFVLDISRDGAARSGYSPAARVFEAAGAAACVITDAWEGVELFFEPGREILVAGSGEEVAEILRGVDGFRSRAIGLEARRRALREHTYAQRALEFERALEGAAASVSKGAAGGSVSQQSMFPEGPA